MAEWKDRGRLEAAGKSLEYRCVGPSPDKADTIVLLHEGLGCVEMWRDIPEALSEATGLGVFVFSREGYGQSDPTDLPRPTDFLTREAVEVLPEVLDAIGFRRGLLMGHSDGGTIAAVYAGSVPDYRVRGIIVLAPHFYQEEIGIAAIAAAEEAYKTTPMPQKLARYHKDPDHTFLGWSSAWLSPEFLHWNVADVIDHIRVPTLAIQGMQDQYGTLAQIEEIETRSYAPVEMLVLDPCRHSPHLDRREDVLDAVSEFVARLMRIEAAKVATT